MKIVKSIYLSLLGLPISLIMNIYAMVCRPYMVYGYLQMKPFKYFKTTRISSTAILINKKNIEIADDIWIWHHTIIDGSNGVKIGRGVQIGAWVGIFTHSSHVAIRLYGKSYINEDARERVGYIRGAVEIGDFAFIGAGVSVMPGVKIGRGAIISAHSLITKDVPEFSLVAGNPARVVGSVFEIDKLHLNNTIEFPDYFDREAFDRYIKMKSGEKDE